MNIKELHKRFPLENWNRPINPVNDTAYINEKAIKEFEEKKK